MKASKFNIIYEIRFTGKPVGNPSFLKLTFNKVQGCALALTTCANIGARCGYGNTQRKGEKSRNKNAEK